MMASPDEALKLQRPIPDGALKIVTRGDQGRSGRADNVTDEDDYSQAGPLRRQQKTSTSTWKPSAHRWSSGTMRMSFRVRSESFPLYLS
jgi:hypothetical protein